MAVGDILYGCGDRIYGEEAEAHVMTFLPDTPTKEKLEYLEAEIKARDYLIKQLTDSRDSLESDNKRLRAALERWAIAYNGDDHQELGDAERELLIVALHPNPHDVANDTQP